MKRNTLAAYKHTTNIYGKGLKDVTEGSPAK
jgi:hypothetical protein